MPVEIVKSTSTFQGLKGKVVGETKNLIIMDSKGEKRIPKNSSVFRFTLESGKVDIEGKEILFRPEERAKKLLF